MTCFQACPSHKSHDLLFDTPAGYDLYFTELKQTQAFCITELIFLVSIPVGNYLTIIERPVRLLQR